MYLFSSKINAASYARCLFMFVSCISKDERFVFYFFFFRFLRNCLVHLIFPRPSDIASQELNNIKRTRSIDCIYRLRFFLFYILLIYDQSMKSWLRILRSSKADRESRSNCIDNSKFASWNNAEYTAERGFYDDNLILYSTRSPEPCFSFIFPWFHLDAAVSI